MGSALMEESPSTTQDLPNLRRQEREKRQRLAVDMTPAAMARLSEIQEQLGLKSGADVARAAFELLNWYAVQRKEGYQIRLVKDGESKEVELFFLGL